VQEDQWVTGAGLGVVDAQTVDGDEPVVHSGQRVVGNRVERDRADTIDCGAARGRPPMRDYFVSRTLLISAAIAVIACRVG
jgi:hypothetical protein